MFENQFERDTQENRKKFFETCENDENSTCMFILLTDYSRTPNNRAYTIINFSKKCHPTRANLGPTR